MQQRPKGVTVLALLALVGGILSFAAGYVLMLGGGLGSAFGASGGGTVMVLGALTFAIGLSSFMLGYGFWAMKPWAWPAAFLLYGVAIAVNLASVLVAGASGERHLPGRHRGGRDVVPLAATEAGGLRTLIRDRPGLVTGA